MRGLVNFVSSEMAQRAIATVSLLPLRFRLDPDPRNLLIVP